MANCDTIESETCYRIKNNKIAKSWISELGLHLHACEYLIDGFGEVRVSRGKQNIHFESYTLPVIQTLAARLIPWCTVYFAPALNRPEEVQGVAYVGRDSTIVRFQSHPGGTISVFLHEAWHLLEYNLTAEEVRIVTQRVENGPNWPDLEYYATPVERRARAFQNWAMSRIEMGFINPADIDRSSAATKVFSLVLSGGLTLRMARRGSLERACIDAEMRARLSDRGPLIVAWDFCRRAVVAGYHWMTNPDAKYASVK